MKKKLALLVSASLLLATTVSASSQWGSFKGNDVVQVKIDNKAFDPGDRTPAILYNGSVMVPASILRAVGLGYTYDSASKTISFQDEAKRVITLNTITQKIKDLNKYLDIYKQLGDFENSFALLDQSIHLLKLNSLILASVTKPFTATENIINKHQMGAILSFVKSNYNSMNNTNKSFIVTTNAYRTRIPKVDIRIPSFDSILDSYQDGLDKTEDFLNKVEAQINNGNYNVQSFDEYDAAKSSFNKGFNDSNFAFSNLKNYISTYNPSA